MRDEANETNRNDSREELIGPLLTRLMEPFHSIEIDRDTRFSRNHLWFQSSNSRRGWRSGLDNFTILALGQVTEIIFPAAQKSLVRGMNL